jgi:Leucine-rich repeat (LRR) protein
VVASFGALRELDLSGNELTAFPLLLSEMPILEKLHLRSNPFLTKEGEAVYLPLIKKLEENPAEVYY